MLAAWPTIQIPNGPTDMNDMRDLIVSHDLLPSATMHKTEVKLPNTADTIAFDLFIVTIRKIFLYII